MVLIPKLLFYTGAGTGISVGLQRSCRTTASFFLKKKKAFLFVINSDCTSVYSVYVWFVTVLYGDKTK